MRQIHYTIIYPGGHQTDQKDLFNFLISLPHLFYFNYVPSQQVINAFLAYGEDDGYAHLQWQPFSIDEIEYRQILLKIKRSNCCLKLTAVPDEIDNREKWHAWVMEQALGIPYQDYLSLNYEQDHYRRLKQEAKKRGDRQKSIEYHRRLLKANRHLIYLIEKHLYLD